MAHLLSLGAHGSLVSEEEVTQPTLQRSVPEARVVRGGQMLPCALLTVVSHLIPAAAFEVESRWSESLGNVSSSPWGRQNRGS